MTRKTFSNQVVANPLGLQSRRSSLEQAGTKKVGPLYREPTAAEKASDYFVGEFSPYNFLPRDYTPSEYSYSDSDASNPEGERALESAVIWRKVQRKQTIQALALLCYKWLQDGGFKNLPDPRDVLEVLALVGEEVMGDYSFADLAVLSETEYMLLTSTSEAMVLWLEKNSRPQLENYHLGPIRPSPEDLGGKYETICAAIDYLGGWETAVSLQYLLEGKSKYRMKNLRSIGSVTSV